MKVNLHGKELKANFHQYNNGRLAIELTCNDEGYEERWTVATINIPEIKLGENQVIIKNYSENEGVLDALIEAGIVSKPINFVQISGFVHAPVCELEVENPFAGE